MNPPPSFSEKPSWATALLMAVYRGGSDHNPYYWSNGVKYKRVTSKHKTHRHTDATALRLSDLRCIKGVIKINHDTRNQYDEFWSPVTFKSNMYEF